MSVPVPGLYAVLVVRKHHATDPEKQTGTLWPKIKTPMSAVTVLLVPSNCSLSGRSLCVGFLLLDMPFLMTPFFTLLHIV